jgi:hypothetical protein
MVCADQNEMLHGNQHRPLIKLHKVISFNEVNSAAKSDEANCSNGLTQYYCSPVDFHFQQVRFPVDDCILTKSNMMHICAVVWLENA